MFVRVGSKSSPINISIAMSSCPLNEFQLPQVSESWNTSSISILISTLQMLPAVDMCRVWSDIKVTNIYSLCIFCFSFWNHIDKSYTREQLRFLLRTAQSTKAVIDIIWKSPWKSTIPIELARVCRISRDLANAIPGHGDEEHLETLANGDGKSRIIATVEWGGST